MSLVEQALEKARADQERHAAVATARPTNSKPFASVVEPVDRSALIPDARTLRTYISKVPNFGISKGRC
jgi:hypothetical protein